MGYRIACGDVMPGCAAVFLADSEGELIELVTAHAAEDHADVELDDGAVGQVLAAIHPA